MKRKIFCIIPIILVIMGCASGGTPATAILHLETHFYEFEELGRICIAKYCKPGYPLQSFGCATWISPAIPSAGALAGNYRSQR
jgi:hypothetical protein